MKIEIIESGIGLIPNTVRNYDKLLGHIRDNCNLPFDLISHVHVRIKSGLISDYAKLADWDLFVSGHSSEDITLILFDDIVFEGDQYYCGFFVRTCRKENDFIAAVARCAEKCARFMIEGD